jgi:hypothetical protein
MGAVKDETDLEEAPVTYPPGFEPPTDINVPWYAWVLWPLAVVVALAIAAVVFHGFFGALS